MSHFRISAPAQADLDDIWDYIAEDSPHAADRFISILHEEFLTLAKFPQLGRSCEKLAPTLRMFPVRNYVILYRLIDNRIEIVRVLHGARNIQAMLKGES